MDIDYVVQRFLLMVPHGTGEVVSQQSELLNNKQSGP